MRSKIVFYLLALLFSLWLINDEANAQIVFTANPTSTVPGGAVTASWSGIGVPTSRDWIGLYTPGAANSSYLSWMYVSCSQTSGVARASGSCLYGLPNTTGTYELRLFSNDNFTLLATSNPFTASTLPIVTIAVTTATVAENSVSSTGLFTVSRTGSTTAALTVNYTVSGTAT